MSEGFELQGGKELKDKFEAFLASVAEDLMGDEGVKKLNEILRKRLVHEKAGTSLPYLRAVRIGFELSMASEGQMKSALLAGINKLIADKAKAVEEQLPEENKKK